MKSLGQDVTEPDIDEMIKEADKNCKKHLFIILCIFYLYSLCLLNFI